MRVSNRHPKTKRLHLKASAFVPFLLLGLILVLHFTLPEKLDPGLIFEPYYLLPVLNTIFISFASLWNPAAEKTFGYAPHEALGFSLYDLIVAEEYAADFARILQPFSDDRDREIARQIEVVARGKSGGLLPVEVSVSGTWISGRAITTVVIRDITERKQAEAALKQREEELSRLNETLELRVQERTAELERRNAELQDFTFAASHDLQEPLRKIQTFGDILIVKTWECLSEEGRGYIARMQATAARMQQLLRSLLEYSRTVSKSDPLVPVNVEEVVRGVLSNLEVQIKEANGTVEIGDLPAVEADAILRSYPLHSSPVIVKVSTILWCCGKLELKGGYDEGESGT